MYDLKILAYVKNRPITVKTDEGFITVGPRNGQPHLLISQVKGNRNNTGHFTPLTFKNFKDARINDLEHIGSACGVQVVIFQSKKDELMQKKYSEQDAEAEARKFANDPKEMDKFIGTAKFVVLNNPNLKDTFLDRSHESSIVGGLYKDGDGKFRLSDEDVINLKARIERQTNAKRPNKFEAQKDTREFIDANGNSLIGGDGGKLTNHHIIGVPYILEKLKELVKNSLTDKEFQEK